MTDYRIRCGETDALGFEYCMRCGSKLVMDDDTKTCSKNCFHVRIFIDDDDDVEMRFV